MADLYATLGLDRACTAEQIKKAYRNMAKKHHPDIGGDPKHFALVKTAYDTLKDKQKRQNYDEYGVIGDSVTVNKGELVENRLRQVFMLVLSKCPLEELESVNIVARMRAEVLQAINKLEVNKAKTKEGKDATKKVLKIIEKRLKRKGQKINFLVEMLRWGLTESDQNVFQIEKELGVHAEMLKCLEEFSYECELGVQRGWSPVFSGFDFL